MQNSLTDSLDTKTMIDNADDRTKLIIMAKEIVDINENLDKINRKLDNLGNVFVTKAEFLPVKSFVYGLISFTLLAVLAALIDLIIKR